MRAAAEADDGFERLRSLVKQFLDEGIDADVLLADLDEVRGLVAKAHEDHVLDVMDLLVGWCAPHARLVDPG